MIDDSLKSYEADIAKLQAKLREARARQNAIATRFESAVTRAKTREIMNGSRTEDAFSRFELLERRADFAEGRAEALGIGSLEDEIDRAQGVGSDRRRTGRHESRAHGAGELEGDGDNGPQDLSIFARSQGREDRRGLLDAGRPLGDRPDLHPHRLGRGAAADPDRFHHRADRLRDRRHLPRDPEAARGERRDPAERLRSHGPGR